MDTKKYEILLKVLETGSLSRAAREADYTQSGISHVIHSIERAWDITLLRRTHAGVSLTPEGRRLVPYVRDICNMEQRLSEELHAIRGQQVGQIRVGAFTSVSSHLLPMTIRQYEERHPGVEFEIRQGNYTEIEGWLLEGAVDIGFLPEPVSDKLVKQPLLTDKLLVVLPRGHPLTAYEELTPQQLAEEPFIMMDVGAVNPIEMFFYEHRTKPRIKYKVRDDYTILSLVECGLGVSIMYELLLRLHDTNVEVRELAFAPCREIVVAHQQVAATSRIVRTFLRELGVVAKRLNMER